MSDEKQGLSRDQAIAYWKENIRTISILLVIWAVVSYGCGIVFAPALNAITIGGLPLGFWFAQQGSMFVFIILIFVYAFWMDSIDKKYGVNE